MDWTGGTRRRFAAGRNNATVQKQKAHFAKARAALCASTGSHRGFKPSFLRHGSVTQGPVSSRNGSQGHRHNVVPLKQDHFSRPTSSSIHPPHRVMPQYELLTQSSMTDEERLLLARRRRLLARKDWLGLHVARPVEIKFQASEEKARIGKRRKVSSSVYRRRPEAVERPVQRDDRPGSFGSDAINVEIGTEALASQTQRPHRSRNSGNTSMRPPSTDTALLTEEPMVLGSDEDLFEALTPLLDVRHQDIDDEPSQTRWATPAFEKSYGYQQHIPVQAQMIQPPNTWSWSLHANHGRGDSATYQRLDLDQAEIGYSQLEAVSSSEEPPSSVVPDSFAALSPTLPTAATDLAHCVQFQADREEGYYQIAHARNSDYSVADRDEDAWRRFVNVQDPFSTDLSMAALKSSSQHLTTSSNDRYMNRPSLELDQAEQLPLLSTPRGAGTQRSLLTLSRAEQASATTSNEDTASLSPFTSLKRVRELAQTADPPLLPQLKETSEDEMWRAFVVGSQSSSGSPSPRLIPKAVKQDELEDVVSAGPHSPSPVISGLGTSDETMMGGTQAVQSIIMDQPSMSRGQRQAEMDGVYDTLPALAASRAKNIYAGGAISRDHRKPTRTARNVYEHCFRPSQDPGPGAEIPRKATAKARSVYDLVDSDENNLT